MSDASRSIGASEVTYQRWCNEFGGRQPDTAKRLMEPDLEKSRSLRAMPDLTLDSEALVPRLVLGERGQSQEGWNGDWPDADRQF